MIFGRDPARWIELIKAVVMAATAFGYSLNPNQETAIIGLAVVVVTMIAGTESVRSLVTPVSDPVLPAGTSVTTPNGNTATVRV